MAADKTRQLRLPFAVRAAPEASLANPWQRVPARDGARAGSERMPPTLPVPGSGRQARRENDLL